MRARPAERKRIAESAPKAEDGMPRSSWRVLDDVTYDWVEQVLVAASYPSRMKILVSLLGRSQSVGDLAKATEGDLSSVSKQLRVLRHAGLVVTSRKGREVHCRIADDAAKRFTRFVLSYAAATVVRNGR
jgi:DNA-binding transcriptional ArsR family regulator